jgi:hypothetical protein
MLDANQKYDLLKALYLENQKELGFWRERSWATLKLVVTADVAIAGLALFKTAPLALSGLVIALAAVSSVYLYKNYQRYQERRTIGSRIENALGLFDPGVSCRTTPCCQRTLLSRLPTNEALSRSSRRLSSWQWQRYSQSRTRLTLRCRRTRRTRRAAERYAGRLDLRHMTSTWNVIQNKR